MKEEVKEGQGERERHAGRERKFRIWNSDEYPLSGLPQLRALGSRTIDLGEQMFSIM